MQKYFKSCRRCAGPSVGRLELRNLQIAEISACIDGYTVLT